MIGQGGMGEVYLAQNDISGQKFALKVVSPELMKDSGIRARFVEEARVMSQLKHPNIVQLQHFFEEGGRFFMVLEYISGRSLDDFLDERPLSVDEAVGIAKQVLGGLAYVHSLEAPVVHRDIKPSNILVTPEGRAVIIDFGVAKAVGRKKMTRTGAAVGTYEYMSPEQVQGKEVGPASDVYSMGIVLYKMLSGIVPFPQESEGGFEVMKAHVEAAPPSLNNYREGLPEWLLEMISRSLNKAPEARFAHAEKMLVWMDKRSRSARASLETTVRTSESSSLGSHAPAEEQHSPAAPRSLFTPTVMTVGVVLVLTCVVGLVAWQATRSQVEPGSSFGWSSIGESDLNKWSQNEEGLKNITEVVQDADVPFGVKVDAMVILVENGWANRIREIIEGYGEQGSDDSTKLASAVCEKLIETLEAGGESAHLASYGIFHILEIVDDGHLDIAQRALTAWAFAGVTADQSLEEVWHLVSNKIVLSQVRDLGHYAVPYALIMIEKRVESEAWGLLNWVEFVFSFYNPEDEDPVAMKKAMQYRADALNALKRYHVEVFEKMESDPELFFDPNDILIVEKFDLAETVDYLLELAIHPKVDPATQYEALIIAENMFETVVPEKDYDKYSDIMTSTILHKIPEIRDRTGLSRLKQAQIVLDKSQIQGLSDIALVVEKVGDDGKPETKFKPYASARDYHPGRFVFGVVGDFLQPLVDDQKKPVIEEWFMKGLAEKPNFTDKAEFIAELEFRVDKSVTPIVEDWLTSELRLKRIFGLAGLKYLGTPKAKRLLEGLMADKTDIASFLGKGATIGMLAGNGVKGIEMSKELQQLKLDAMRDKILSPGEVERLRKRMLADLALNAEELEKKYVEELKMRQERYLEQKAKLAKLVASYQRAIRRLCLAEITQYPSADKRAELERYIENTAISCRKEAESRLKKEKLDFFGFTQDGYRSAVILGLIKREIARKYVIKAKARAYLKATVEQGFQDARVQKDLDRVKKWVVTDRKLRAIVDRFVDIGLGMAMEDSVATNGKRGISAADISEYRDYLERPVDYVMANILVLQGKLEWNEEDAMTKKWVARSLFEEAAAKAFAPAAYFDKEGELVDFLMENYDDLWYVLQELSSGGPDGIRDRWGMSAENFAHYKRLHIRMVDVRDLVIDAAVKEKRLAQAQADVVKKLYPSLETVSTAMVAEFEKVRGKRLIEEEKRRQENEAKAVK